MPPRTAGSIVGGSTENLPVAQQTWKGMPVAVWRERHEGSGWSGCFSSCCIIHLRAARCESQARVTQAQDVDEQSAKGKAGHQMHVEGVKIFNKLKTADASSHE